MWIEQNGILFSDSEPLKQATWSAQQIVDAVKSCGFIELGVESGLVLWDIRSP